VLTNRRPSGADGNGIANTASAAADEFASGQHAALAVDDYDATNPI
jgi:hypothetical protein